MRVNAGNGKSNVGSEDLPLFEREYFIQTRKEIDTEKRERDRLLHFAILVLVGVPVAALQKAELYRHVFSWAALFVEVPLLIILSAMFWARWKKLTQIADRWYVLLYLLRKHLGNERAGHFLEQTVVDGLSKRRYVRKDAILNFCLCLPVYVIMIATFINYVSVGLSIHGLPSLVFALLHAISSFLLLARRIRASDRLRGALDEAVLK